MLKTKGRLEAEISDTMTRFEKEYMGRGPLETRTFLVEDMVLVRLRGVLTPAEQQLVSGEKSSEGRQLVKRMRSELVEQARTLLETIIKSITGCNVVSLHTDISTTKGERVILFVLDGIPHYLER
ncbi:MAG: Na-translocating system protein MpsC family protein [Armatimonadota bacterium]